MFLEIIVCGWVPAFLLVIKKTRENNKLLWIAVFLGAMGAMVNRWVMVLQVLAAPVLSFESWNLYFPSWQEFATTLLPVALGVVLISISYRYLPIFPQEKELNPISRRL